MKNIYRKLINALLIVGSVIVVMGILEGVLRLYHTKTGEPVINPPTPYRYIAEYGGSRLIPGADVMFRFESTNRFVRVRVNELGFRGPPLPEKSDDYQRLLILGDSVAFGYGVHESRIFAAILDSVLSEMYPPWRVLNAGVEDIGIRDERMILQDVADEIEPRFVLLCFFPNDSRPPVGFRGEYIVEDPVDRWFRNHPGLLHSSHLLRFLHFRYRLLLTRFALYKSPVPARFRWVDSWNAGKWKTDERDLRLLIEEARFDWGAAWYSESWTIVEEELMRIQSICSEMGADLMVAYFPVNIQIEGQFTPTEPQQRLEAICRIVDVPFVDLTPALHTHTGMFLDQCHLTVDGHAVVASKLMEYIRKEIAEK